MYAKAIAESGASRKGVKLPVIAAVDGHCLKAGMGWLISADMAIAREDVTFAFPEVRMGGVPMMVMARCMDYIPKKIALKAYYSSEPFDAETALRFGLINEICTAEDFEKTLDRYVHMIIDYPKALIQMTHDAYYAMEAMATKKERVRCDTELFLSIYENTIVWFNRKGRGTLWQPTSPHGRLSSYFRISRTSTSNTRTELVGILSPAPRTP